MPMPQITVRPYQEQDRDAFFHVRAMTYNDGKPIAAEDQVFKTTRGYVGQVDGVVAGVFSVLDFTCTRGEATFRDAAVAGVAVLPEFRRSGVGSAMMTEALRLFRSEGIPMASLYAFRESYYRRFGYEACGSRVKLTLPNSRYPKLSQSLPVRRLEMADAGLLQPCYETFCRKRSGMNIRTDLHWSRVLGKDISIYAAGYPIEAYLLINHQWQFWEGQAASELVWTTRRGYDSILSILCGVGINKTSVEWYEPSDGPFIQRFFDQGVKANIERLVMYRATDVPALLRALKPEGSGEFTVLVPDNEIPQNVGPWKVEFSPKEVSVEASETADIELPIQTFVQALLGEPSLTDLIRNGLVCSKSEKALLAAQLLLPPSPTYCSDFF
jgi:predicted acetyltransferase